ncbi:MAG: tRNA dihydrouridine synthase DusB [Geobacteraceae bacterium]|nr:tRNA dihydrouridine synthase DusB [Geobacteraceae bacterium]
MSKSLVIGSLAVNPPLILAPMAGLSDLALRTLAREQGAPLCFTEMISAQGLIRGGKNTLPLLRSNSFDRPLGVQLFGDEPSALAEAARIVEDSCDLIDINMGCPVRKVVAGGAGSALLKDPGKAGKIVEAVRKAISVPLTIKIRTGWTACESTYKEIACIAESEGCDAVTLHPRSRAQMFADHSDWSRIAELKNTLKIPVIGSGDIFAWADVRDMFHETGCDGVMIARGVLGNPWIFGQYRTADAGYAPLSPTADEKRHMTLRHLMLLCDLYGKDCAVKEMRKHLSWYVKGMAGSAKFRAKINEIVSYGILVDQINNFFSGGNP